MPGVCAECLTPDPCICIGRKKPKAPPEGQGHCDTRVRLHRLWRDHVSYTRSYITARAIRNLTAADNFAGRLMKNQEEIGSAFGAGFGDKAGKKLTKLLKEHIEQAAAIISATVDGKHVKPFVKAWYKNAEEIAEFLEKTSDKYDLKTAKKTLKMHLDHTLTEAKFVFEEFGSKGDIENYDLIVADIEVMSDFLWQGM
jgi:hypothetical protein